MNISQSSQLVNTALGILTTSSEIENLMLSVLKKFNLTLQQYNVLRILSSSHPHPITLKVLTEDMIDKSSNTSRLVDKLTEKALTNRHTVPSDGRIIHISITDKGLKVLSEASELLETDLHNKLDYISLMQIQKFLRPANNLGLKGR